MEHNKIDSETIRDYAFMYAIRELHKAEEMTNVLPKNNPLWGEYENRRQFWDNKLSAIMTFVF